MTYFLPLYLLKSRGWLRNPGRVIERVGSVWVADDVTARASLRISCTGVRCGKQRSMPAGAGPAVCRQVNLSRSWRSSPSMLVRWTRAECAIARY